MAIYGVLRSAWQWIAPILPWWLFIAIVVTVFLSIAITAGKANQR